MSGKGVILNHPNEVLFISIFSLVRKGSHGRVVRVLASEIFVLGSNPKPEIFLNKGDLDYQHIPNSSRNFSPYIF